MSTGARKPDRAGGLRARLRGLWTTLIHEGRTPGRIAAAIVAGSVIGWSPLFGLHLLLAVLVGSIFRLNRLLVYATAQVSIPPLAPLLGFLSIQLGHRILRGGWVAASLDEFRRRDIADLATDFLASWFLGSTLLGLATGIAGAAVALLVLRRRDARRFPGSTRIRIRAALCRARHRFAALHPRVRWHVAAKSRLDPCYRAACSLLPSQGRIIDLGTGVGILPLALAELSPDIEVLAVEHDPERVATARRAASGLARIRVEVGDARTAPLPPCAAVVLLDVLHYFTPAEQRTLLGRAVAALQPGGRLVIREHDAASGSGASWTRIIERLSVAGGWNRADRVRFGTAAVLRADLLALGLRVHVVGASGCLPGNVLLCGSKPMDSAAPHAALGPLRSGPAGLVTA